MERQIVERARKDKKWMREKWKSKPRMRVLTWGTFRLSNDRPEDVQDDLLSKFVSHEHSLFFLTRKFLP